MNRNKKTLPQGSYSLLDSGNFRRLEQVGPWRLIRPCAQASWPPQADTSQWESADYEFVREPEKSREGTSLSKGVWQNLNARPHLIPEEWTIQYEDIKLIVKPTQFGHLGLFPEHLANIRPSLQDLSAAIKTDNQPIKALHLFAYTGAISCLLRQYNCDVTHVDASKTSIAWAKRNEQLNFEGGSQIRWICEDALKFCQREVRRGATYDLIILDPPSYGRGPKGKVWKIETMINEILNTLASLQSNSFKMIFLSCHSPGFTPVSLANLLDSWFPNDTSAERNLHLKTTCGEMLLPAAQGFSLPSGNFALRNRN